MIASASPVPYPAQPTHTYLNNDRSRYRFGKTLGAGTYGIVREADCPEGKVAVKIILKKNVRGNEQMVYDELEMLQRMKHPHIVKFHDWFESRVCPPYATHTVRSADSSRTNTTLSLNWQPAASCLTAFARRESSLRRMPPKPFDRS